MGDYPEALSLCIEALKTRKNILGENHPDYFTSLCDLADIYVYTGKYDTAKILLQQALIKRKEVLGPQHPDYAETIKNLGLIYCKMGNLKDGGSMLLQANNVKLSHLIKTNSTLSEQEKITRLDEELKQFYYLPSLLYTSKAIQPKMLQQVYANELCLKGMALEEQQLFANDHFI